MFGRSKPDGFLQNKRRGRLAHRRLARRPFPKVFRLIVEKGPQKPCLGALELSEESSLPT